MPHRQLSCQTATSYPARSTTGRETPRAQTATTAWRLTPELTSRELTADGALPFANPCLTLYTATSAGGELQRWPVWSIVSNPAGKGHLPPDTSKLPVDRILARNHKLENFLPAPAAGSGRCGRRPATLQIVTFAKVRGGVVIFSLRECDKPERW